jgi:hypothetical protein
VTARTSQDARSAALDAYLVRQAANGYRVETKSHMQAVICRRSRFYFVLRWFAHTKAERRLVVSVDEHGIVTYIAAEPVRW